VAPDEDDAMNRPARKVTATVAGALLGMLCIAVSGARAAAPSLAVGKTQLPETIGSASAECGLAHAASCAAVNRLVNPPAPPQPPLGPTLRPGSANEVGAGASGSVWIVGTNPVAGGFGIWHWTGTTWAAVPGGAVRIAVDPSGRPWVVTSLHQIYHWTGSVWTLFPGAATDIGVGANGSVWAAGTNPVADGFSISHWTGTTWTTVPGAAVRIAVDPIGSPWVINSSHQILSFVDADIAIAPSSTDEVGAAHIFTVTVKADRGAGAGLQPVAGLFPTVTISPTPPTVTNDCATSGTDAAGGCTVIINSPTAGTFTANAKATLTVDGVTLTRDTAAYPGPGGTGPARQTYVTQLPFVSAVSANGRYLVDQYGNPFLINGDSAWNVAWALDAADQNTYLADRAKDGFNTIVTDLVGSPGTMQGNPNGANYAGDLPFSDSNFTPNPTYWAKIDTFFQEAAQNGMSVFAIPIDAYATGSVFGDMTTAQAQVFGTFLAQRYSQSQYPGIVWMLGNDYAGDGAGCCNDGFVSQYQALLSGLAAGGSTRPTTIEQGFYESLSTDGSSLGPLVSSNAAYTYHPTYADVLRGWATADIPVFFFEGAYENAVTGFPSAPLDLRKQLAWSMTSGATGTFYGNDSLWMFREGWQDQLDTTDVAQRQALDAAFAGIKWWTLQPDTTSRLVTAGRNTQDTTLSVGVNTPFTDDPTYGNYVTAAYSPDGTLAVIYNPDTTQDNITISSALLGANATITAVDPTSGATTSLGWTTTPTMGANAGGDHDWLFIINAAPAA
jgi:hypothetical protein